MVCAPIVFGADTGGVAVQSMRRRFSLACAWWWRWFVYVRALGGVGDEQKECTYTNQKQERLKSTHLLVGQQPALFQPGVILLTHLLVEVDDVFYVVLTLLAVLLE
jgi:hypothetical protein